MNALEQSLADLCAKHELTHLGVGYTPAHRFGADVHAEGRLCALGHGDTLAQALGNAIADLNAKRSTAEPITLADEPLTEMAA